MGLGMERGAWRQVALADVWQQQAAIVFEAFSK